MYVLFSGLLIRREEAEIMSADIGFVTNGTKTEQFYFEDFCYVDEASIGIPFHELGKVFMALYYTEPGQVVDDFFIKVVKILINSDLTRHSSMGDVISWLNKHKGEEVWIDFVS